EDGIRDFHVTGVQTCALPISCACTSDEETPEPRSIDSTRPRPRNSLVSEPSQRPCLRGPARPCLRGPASAALPPRPSATLLPRRSEERRVGHEGRAGRAAERA